MDNFDRARLLKSKGRSNVSVALVRGPIVSTLNALNNEATPAIALAYLSGYLEKYGYNAKMVDAIGEGLSQMWPIENWPGYQCQGLTFDEIVARIPGDVDVIGISAMFSGEWPITRELIEYIRCKFPNSVIVAGGEHITALTEYSLRECPAIDFCIRGEGESGIHTLLEKFISGETIDDVPGISHFRNGEYIANTELPRVRDINSIPWPKWPDGYMETFWQAGKSYGPQTGRDMPMMLSRGCPYRCTFCSNPEMWTTRYILRDVDDVVAEVKSYIEKHDITAVQLYDLTAITKKKWTVEFLRKLLDNNIDVKWALPSGTRSEVLDKETLILLNQVGCNYLVYAPESGSPEMLERLNKKLNLKNLNGSIKEALALKMVVRANIILGFPGETRLDLYKTLVYGIGLSIRGVDEVQPNLYSPYPGSQLFHELLETRQITLGDSYFLSLTSLNSDLSIFQPLTFNEYMGAAELAFYRLVFTALNYGLGYLFHPRRIIRTWRNLFGSGDAATVFEHRLKDALHRRRAANSIETGIN